MPFLWSTAAKPGHKKRPMPHPVLFPVQHTNIHSLFSLSVLVILPAHKSSQLTFFVQFWFLLLTSF